MNVDNLLKILTAKRRDGEMVVPKSGVKQFSENLF